MGVLLALEFTLLDPSIVTDSPIPPPGPPPRMEGPSDSDGGGIEYLSIIDQPSQSHCRDATWRRHLPNRRLALAVASPESGADGGDG
jgi:hypothetical protein